MSGRGKTMGRVTHSCRMTTSEVHSGILSIATRAYLQSRYHTFWSVLCSKRGVKPSQARVACRVPPDRGQTNARRSHPRSSACGVSLTISVVPLLTIANMFAVRNQTARVSADCFGVRASVLTYLPSAPAGVLANKGGLVAPLVHRRVKVDDLKLPDDAERPFGSRRVSRGHGGWS